MATEEPAETWEMEEWEKDTWNSLIPRLHQLRAGWLSIIRQFEREYPDANSSEYYTDYHFVHRGWMVAVMEAMRERPDLRAFRPMLSHSTAHFPCGGARLWVDATAEDHFTARRAIYDASKGYDVTLIGEGNAKQTAERVETYLQQHANKE